MRSVQVLNRDKIVDKEDLRHARGNIQSASPSRIFSWQITYNFAKTCQHNLILKYTSLSLQNKCRKGLRNVRSFDMTISRSWNCVSCKSRSCIDLFQCSSSEIETVTEEHVSDSNSSDFREIDGILSEPKMKTYDEYKRLVELTKSKSKPKSFVKPLLIHTTSLNKIQVLGGRTEIQPPLNICEKRKIIKAEPQRTILVASTNHVTFHNFVPNKLYKKVVTLQNVSACPATFNIERMTTPSKFTIFMKLANGEKKFICPGMQLQLIVLFRCDIYDEPDELLLINVQHGKSIIIRLQGYRDPPILKKIHAPLKESSAEFYNPLREKLTSSIHFRYTDSLMETEQIIIESSESSVEDSVVFKLKKYICMDFDCKKCFAGEQIYVPLKFRNVGGGGRFFIISEIDWCSMHIEDVTDRNMLILPSFAIWPAYFSLNIDETIELQIYFYPEAYGIHVDKLYIVCDNCSVISAEIFGDGIIYEPQFIQIYKEFRKPWSPEVDVDKKARYYLNMNGNISNRITRNIISVINCSELSIYFRWEKRNVERQDGESSELNYFPLELIDIQPSRGIFSPSCIHHFTVNAVLENILPSRYFAVLQLYIEDIPAAAISKKIEQENEESTVRRRVCSKVNVFINSVDIWIGDVEVWIQCASKEISEKSKRIAHASEEAADSDSTTYTKSDYSLLDYVDKTNISTDNSFDQIKDDQKTTRSLTPEEYFLHYDIINLHEIEALFRKQILSIGVIRPPRPLYVGVEETFYFTLKNISGGPLNYTLGKPTGLDLSKLQICTCPKTGEICVGFTEQVEIKFVPLKKGVVRSLHVPCFIGQTRKMIILKIECKIEVFYVSFYPPPQSGKSFDSTNESSRLEWHADSVLVALDLAGQEEGNKEKIDKCGTSIEHHFQILQRVLNKYKTREERELMNIDLDQGNPLKDTSAGPSIQELPANKTQVEYSSSSPSGKIQIQENYNRKTDIENVERNNYRKHDGRSCRNVIPFQGTVLSKATRPIIIKYLDVPINTVKRKTFIIKNETPASSYFQIDIKNFYPIANASKKNSKKFIASTYKKIFCQKKDIIDEELRAMKQPKSGIVIYVELLESFIGPFELIPIHVYIFADTWGTYMDELEINVTGLPQYTIEIYAQVIGSPISIPAYQGTLRKVPIFRFGTLRSGIRSENRKVLMKNTSVLPIAVNWHIFIIKPTVSDKKLPFNVVLDILTPFTNSFTSWIIAGGKINDYENVVEFDMESYKSEETLEVLDKFDHVSITDSNPNKSTISAAATMGTSYTYCSFVPKDQTSSCKQLFSTEDSSSFQSTCFSFSNEEDEHQTTSCCSSISGTIKSVEMRNTDFNISLIPYYGDVDTNVCEVSPKQMFIPSKESSFLTITVYPDEILRHYGEKEFICKAVGFLRIAPRDRYRDHCYFREDGRFLAPLEIDIMGQVIKPRLVYDIPKSNKIFTFCANSILRNPRKRSKMKKTYIFYNCDNDVVKVHFEIHDPFCIESISVYAETYLYDSADTICINGHACAEVEIACTVDHNVIENAMEMRTDKDVNNSTITLNELLIITHTDETNQVEEFTLKILLSSIKLSKNTLNFDLVYVGDTRKLVFVIENLAECKEIFKISQKFNNPDYTIDRMEGELPRHSINGSSVTITVTFKPSRPGKSIEHLEIITIPTYTKECILYGEGTLDEKYHIPGI